MKQCNFNNKAITNYNKHLDGYEIILNFDEVIVRTKAPNTLLYRFKKDDFSINILASKIRQNLTKRIKYLDERRELLNQIKKFDRNEKIKTI